MPNSLIYLKQEERLKEYGAAIRALESRVESQSANLRAGERERKQLAGEIVALRNEVGSLRKALLETMGAIHALEYNEATPGPARRRLASEPRSRDEAAGVQEKVS
jgi:chromosome segregation ATPase